MYVIVTNHVNWHMEHLPSDREKQGMQFEWVPWDGEDHAPKRGGKSGDNLWGACVADPGSIPHAVCWITFPCRCCHSYRFDHGMEYKSKTFVCTDVVLTLLNVR